MRLMFNVLIKSTSQINDTKYRRMHYLLITCHDFICVSVWYVPILEWTYYLLLSVSLEFYTIRNIICFVLIGTCMLWVRQFYRKSSSIKWHCNLTYNHSNLKFRFFKIHPNNTNISLTPHSEFCDNLTAENLNKQNWNAKYHVPV